MALSFDCQKSIKGNYLYVLMAGFNQSRKFPVNMKIITENYLLVLGAILGGGVFFFIFGYKILDPTFLEWTMQSDAATHFLGWHFFRSEPWSFPLCNVSSYQYPIGTSLIYTDSIPLLAIPLKLFSPLLPKIFQYHGLWLLVCYILQGCFAILLLKHISKNPLLISIGSIFFLLSPIVVTRSTSHEALAAHWLILASLYIFFEKDSIRTRVKWLLLLLIALMVHFYLFTMIFFIFSVYYLEKIFQNQRKQYVSCLKYYSVSLISCISFMWILGYFVIGVGNSYARGYGFYSMNLVAPINSHGFSLFLPAITNGTIGQIEGFNYFGIGLLLLVMTALFQLFHRKNLSYVNKNTPIILICMVLTLFAISNKIYFSNQIILEYPLPYYLEQLFNVFRASGRMFWPVTYLLCFSSIAIIIKFNSFQRALTFLFIFVCIQFVDLFSWYNNYHLENIAWSSNLQSPYWQLLMEKTNHINFIPPTRDKDDYVPFALLAANNDSTINVGYSARNNNEKNDEYKKKLIEEIREGKIQHDSIYLIKKDFFYPPQDSSKFVWGNLDGYSIIAPKTERYQEYPLEPWPIRIAVEKETMPLSTLINSYMVPGYSILLSVRGDVTKKLPHDFYQKMEDLGSSISKLEYGDSYGSLIVNGNLVLEKNHSRKRVVLRHEVYNHKIKIVSAGSKSGNYSWVYVDDDNISLSPNRQGLNFIILNAENNEILRYNMVSKSLESISLETQKK